MVLKRAIACLDEARVPALVTKGALLAHVLYASPIERPLRDLDLRVRPGDFERAHRALSEIATPVRRSRAYGSAVLTANGTDLDVESTIGPPFLCRLSVDSMILRAVKAVKPLGFVHLQPELHDHALLLAVNAFKDHVAHASSWSLVDLERIVLLPGFDPGVLAGRAREHRATNIVHVVASHLARRVTAGSADSMDSRRIWGLLAKSVRPARPRFAREMLSWLSAPTELTVARRLRIRGGADERARAAAALLASALWEVETKASRGLLRLRLALGKPPR
jgi:hypothetical protein